MTPLERTVTAWLSGQQQAMIALLADLVNIDSGSYDKAGVDSVGARIEKFCSAYGMSVHREPVADFGDAIHVTLDDAPTNERPVLLLGHRDTVFPKGEAERRPFSLDSGRAYGPGVADMKAGLVVNAFVMAAYKRAGGAPAPLKALFTGDEEIGSPSSRPIIENAARAARAVFNSEPGRPSGNIVTGRKGGVFMRIRISGKPAHAGGNFEAGISAINELAHKIIALGSISDIPAGVTLNVGIISGGEAVNMVAPWAEADVDLRYISKNQRDAAMARIEAIVAQAFIPGTGATLEIRGEFVPLVQTSESERLFAVYRGAAEDLGSTVDGEFSGGCADSGFTAAVGCPTLCSVGPIGGKAHTPDEYLEIASLVPRAQALALAVARVA